MKTMGWVAIGAAVLLLVACGGGGETDKCQDVRCDAPPASTCKDASTIIEYEPEGACLPSTGECEYGSGERTCAQGCEDGACVGERVVHGWITLLEKVSQAGWDGQPPVAAYFAAAPHYRRSIPQQAPLFLRQGASQGSCVLYDAPLPSPLFMDPCQPPCGADQYCSGMTCMDLPRHYDVGTLTFEGLKTALQVTSDEVDRYQLDSPPEDLFDMGDPVTASTSGGELDPLTLQATGVASLEVASDTLVLNAGTAATYAWTPADPGSRVLLVLRSGLHDPSLPDVAIVCDAPDGDGQIVIDAAMVDTFRETSFVIQKTSVALRYTRQVIRPYNADIELIVGSQQPVLIATP